MRDDDEGRLRRRAERLMQVLCALTPEAFADDAALATLLVTPGFALAAPSDLDPTVAAARMARADAMRQILVAIPVGTRAGRGDVAAYLTAPRADLVHPTTGEQLCPLDAVLRGMPPVGAAG